VQRVRRRSVVDAGDDDDDAAAGEREVTGADVERRVPTSGPVSYWSVSTRTPAVVRGHVACVARPAHQRHSVGLHDDARPTSRRRTPGARRRDVLQVRAHVRAVCVCVCVCVRSIGGPTMSDPRHTDKRHPSCRADMSGRHVGAGVIPSCRLLKRQPHNGPT